MSSKKSKSKQKSFYELQKSIRGSWNDINPVTKVIDRKHYFDLKKVGVNGIEDKDQLTYLLSKNKIYILDALSEEKRKKLLELNI